MNPLFYAYSMIYQASYVLPIYRRLGGVFVAKNFRQWAQFKKYMRGADADGGHGHFLKTPPVKRLNIEKPHNLKGVVLSPSAITIHPGNRGAATIYTGHGSGDKPYYGKQIKEKMAAFDYHFITGPKNIEKLRVMGLDISRNRLIKIGNMRFDDYLNGSIDRERALDRLGIKDRAKKNILYAPTWQWGNGTLLKYALRFSRELPPRYNLIIRPHPHERMLIPRLKRRMRRSGISPVYFSNAAHLSRQDTMADFLVSDVLISDVSSVIYEYLVTAKPMIIIQNNFKKTHRMPPKMTVHGVAQQYDESVDIRDLVDASLQVHDQRRSDYLKLRDRCFYYNDGKSTERAVAFIKSLET